MRKVARPAAVAKWGILTRANARCGEVARTESPGLPQLGTDLARIKREDGAAKDCFSACGRQRRGLLVHRASVPVISDVYVAEHGQNESVMDANAVRQRAFSQGDNRSPDDRLH